MSAASGAAPRLIAHLDMDAFYASVELVRYPELRGRPVAIGGGRPYQPRESVDAATGRTLRSFAALRDYVGRGVITTATYEARALGVHSAMGVMKAAALAPDAILLPPDFDAYRRYSRLFKAAVATVASRIEDRGIDEIYVDLTGVAPTDDTPRAREPGVDDAQDAWRDARRVAQAIKRAVHAATGLSCSIAVAPNKLLAKIASELDKPDGLTMLKPGDVPTRVWPLPARRIPGVGPKTAERLAAIGIATIGDLARADRALLVARFGEHQGGWLHDAAHGRDERPVVTRSEPKSVSRETTFERDLHPRRDRDELSRIFTALCEQVSGDLRRKGCAGRTIGLKLRYDDFTTVTRDRTIVVPTQDAAEIRRAAGACLKRVELARPIRLLGVRVGGLCPEEAVRAEPALPSADPTLPLFE